MPLKQLPHSEFCILFAKCRLYLLASRLTVIGTISTKKFKLYVITRVPAVTSLLAVHGVSVLSELPSVSAVSG